jgi:hypothetical protein
VIGIPDPELVTALVQRDGVIPERYAPHSAAGACRYPELYDGQSCPWCEAEQRRRDGTARFRDRPRTTDFAAALQRESPVT